MWCGIGFLIKDNYCLQLMTYQTYQAWSELKEKLEVEVGNAWIKLSAHENIVNMIA